MKYSVLFLLIILSHRVDGQNQFIDNLQKEISVAQGPDQVDKYLQLAQAYYESGDYPRTITTAHKVMELAPVLVMHKHFQAAQDLVTRCEQIVALQHSKAKSDGMGAMAISLQLSDLFYKNGEYEKAGEFAAESYKYAYQFDNKSFMATALSREAKATLKQENATKDELEDARKKLRSSMNILNEHKVVNPVLKNDNLSFLEELGKNFVNATEFNQVNETVKTIMDSVNIHLRKWTSSEMKNKPRGRRDSTGHYMVIVGHPDSINPEDFYDKLIKMKQSRLAKDLIAPLPPPSPTGQDAKFIVQQVTDEVKDLWPRELKVIESDFEQNETRIAKLAPVDVKKELLQATYKNKYDSLMHLHILDSINLEKQELSIRQHQAEMERQNARRSLMMTGSGSTLLLSFFLLLGFTRQKKHNRVLSLKNVEIQREHERSDELLLNILPARVADELKQFGESKAHRFDNVSVLFSDFIDFTRIAEKLSPEILVKELDYCFKAFDRIINKYDLEKIKTIGDAYMCAGGLSDSSSSQAEEIVKAALEMQQFLNKWKEEKIARGEHFFEARIGIHTGSVVAGVVGMKKYAYDIWGDTVNIASRMELSGEPGRINISGETFKHLKGMIPCAYRGKIKPKNKGEIDMYFVEEEAVSSGVPA